MWSKIMCASAGPGWNGAIVSVDAAMAATRSAVQAGGNGGHVPSLEPGHAQLLWARHARAVVVGDGGGAVGAAALDLVHPHLRLLGIGQADDHHAVVQQRRV